MSGEYDGREEDFVARLGLLKVELLTVLGCDAVKLKVLKYETTLAGFAIVAIAVPIPLLPALELNTALVYYDEGAGAT